MQLIRDNRKWSVAGNSNHELQPFPPETNESQRSCTTCWYCSWRDQRNACWNTLAMQKGCLAGADLWQNTSRQQSVERRHYWSRFLAQTFKGDVRGSVDEFEVKTRRSERTCGEVLSGRVRIEVVPKGIEDDDLRRPLLMHAARLSSYPLVREEIRSIIGRQRCLQGQGQRQWEEGQGKNINKNKKSNQNRKQQTFELKIWRAQRNKNLRTNKIKHWKLHIFISLNLQIEM